MILDLLWLLLIPLLYWGTGLLAAAGCSEGFLQKDEGTRNESVPGLATGIKLRIEVEAIPMLGLAFWGWVGLLRIMSGAPAEFIYGVVAGAAVFVGGLRRKRLAELFEKSLSCMKPWLLAYAIGVVALAVSPYPGLWLMGGDWWNHFDMAVAAHSGQFGVGQLARCPFYAVGCLPILDLSGGRDLVVDQIFSAAAAAAAWLPLLGGVARAAKADARVQAVAWLALGLSPFYTVILQNLWPKFLAGGFVWLALTQAQKFARNRRMATMRVAGWWFACAVLTHESTVIYAPMIVLAAWAGSFALDRVKLSGVIWWGIVCALLIGLWEGWTVWRFGLHARVNSNPAVTFDQGRPLWEKFLLNLTAVLTGVFPIELAREWGRQDLGFVPKAYYTVVGVVSWLGATTLTIALPWLVWARVAVTRVVREVLTSASNRMLAVGSVVAIVAYCCLLGDPPKYGTIQGGLVPLAMWVLGGLVSRLGKDDFRRVRRVLEWSLLAGWVPYVATGLAIGCMLDFPQKFAARIAQLTASDGDLYAVFAEKFLPLGMNFGILVAAAVAAAAIAWQAWRWREKLEQTPD